MNDIQIEKEVEKKFFERRCTKVAEDLIGKLVVNEDNGAAGIIVETEAYLGEDDPACHYNGNSTFRGRSFEKGPATIYVYKMHGHNCMNFICGSEEYPEGALIRALKPVKKIDDMRYRRGFEEIEKLCSGPGKLTEALEVSREKNKDDFIPESNISVFDIDRSPAVERGKRVGISTAENWPLRYVKSGSDFISKPLKSSENGFSEERFYSEASKNSL